MVADDLSATEELSARERELLVWAQHHLLLVDCGVWLDTLLCLKLIDGVISLIGCLLMVSHGQSQSTRIFVSRLHPIALCLLIGRALVR